MNSTSEGLRMTIHSSIDLSNTLLQEYKFDYVLTGRINQDPLEVSMKNKIILNHSTGKRQY